MGTYKQLFKSYKIFREIYCKFNFKKNHLQLLKCYGMVLPRIRKKKPGLKFDKLDCVDNVSIPNLLLTLFMNSFYDYFIFLLLSHYCLIKMNLPVKYSSTAAIYTGAPTPILYFG